MGQSLCRRFLCEGAVRAVAGSPCAFQGAPRAALWLESLLQVLRLDKGPSAGPPDPMGTLPAHSVHRAAQCPRSHMHVSICVSCLCVPMPASHFLLASGENIAADGHTDLSDLEVSLTLTNKFEGREADIDDTNAKCLLLRWVRPLPQNKMAFLSGCPTFCLGSLAF